MGSMSIWHWAIVVVVVLVLFGGRGKLSGIKGIRAFKDGLKDDMGAKDKETPGALPRTDAEKEELNR